MKNDTFNPKYGLIITFLYTAAWIAIYFIMWTIGFVGEKKSCTYKPDKDCFCEFFSFENPLGQTTLTLSNLAYVCIGLLFIIFYIRQDLSMKGDKLNRPQQNQFENLTFYSFFYILLVINIGISSWFMHASGYKWAGIFDTFCMHMFISFTLLYSVASIWQWSKKKFLLIFVPIESLILILNIYNVFKIITRNDLFAILVAVTFGFEVIFLIASKKGKTRGRIREGKYLFYSIISFLLAYMIWTFQKNEIWPCDPYSLIQPHALWHIITAISTWCIFMYLESEKIEKNSEQKSKTLN